ncbi:hypothetical protein QL093DRAFT_2088008 [Fusarium oxysporum]|nr:hypothetical protein QL093DRAFT_2088008 [Fusarium oxysporum]
MSAVAARNNPNIILGRRTLRASSAGHGVVSWRSRRHFEDTLSGDGKFNDSATAATVAVDQDPLFFITITITTTAMLLGISTIQIPNEQKDHNRHLHYEGEFDLHRIEEDAISF